MKKQNSQVLKNSADEVLSQDLRSIENWFRKSDLHLFGNVLVKGASGFIGQWIFTALNHLSSLNPTFKVYAQTSRPEVLIRNWKGVCTTSIEFHTDKDLKFDLIYDMALPQTGNSREDQIKQSLIFLRNALECASETKAGARVIQPSSGAAYGNLRFLEELCEENSTKPTKLTIYGEGKLNVETLHSQFTEVSLDFLTPRIFSVFGPLMREDSPLVGNTFLKQAAKGLDITASKSGNIFRDFTYITDLVKQLIYFGVAGSPISNINLGVGNIYEIAEFGNLVAREAGISFKPGLRSEPRDNYFGCLHNLEKAMANRMDRGVLLTEAINKTILFNKGH
jgi:nucleoside-diphosphate-sugar epimerase